MALFTLFHVPQGPGRSSWLASIRETEGNDETGKIFDISDDWTRPEVAHRALTQRRTGVTVFRTCSFDAQLQQRRSPLRLCVLALP